MVIYSNAVRIRGVVVGSGSWTGLTLSLVIQFCCILAAACLSRVFNLKRFCFLHAELTSEGGGGERGAAACHFCPAGNLWNRFIMFAYNCEPSSCLWRGGDTAREATSASASAVARIRTRRRWKRRSTDEGKRAQGQPAAGHF